MKIPEKTLKLVGHTRGDAAVLQAAIDALSKGRDSGGCLVIQGVYHLDRPIQLRRGVHLYGGDFIGHPGNG